MGRALPSRKRDVAVIAVAVAKSVQTVGSARDANAPRITGEEGAGVGATEPTGFGPAARVEVGGARSA